MLTKIDEAHALLDLADAEHKLSDDRDFERAAADIGTRLGLDWCWSGWGGIEFTERRV